MAELNLLKGGYNGTVGKTTGVISRSKIIIKSRIDGKAPSTALQTANLNAFIPLVRMSAGIVKTVFAPFNLSTETMHRHNALAQYLKAIIANHVFTPEAFGAIVHKKYNTYLYNCTVNQARSSIILDTWADLALSGIPNFKRFLFVINFTGKIQVQLITGYENNRKTLTLPAPWTPPYYGLVLYYVDTPQRKEIFGGNALIGT